MTFAKRSKIPGGSRNRRRALRCVLGSNPIVCLYYPIEYNTKKRCKPIAKKAAIENRMMSGKRF
jgi:hypothetical protein